MNLNDNSIATTTTPTTTTSDDEDGGMLLLKHKISQINLNFIFKETGDVSTALEPYTDENIDAVLNTICALDTDFFIKKSRDCDSISKDVAVKFCIKWEN